MEHRTVLQLVLIDETGDSYYRMRWPARELALQVPDWRVINLDARAAERLTLAREADLLVLFQSQDLSLLPVIAERKRRGKKTLVEYNDNFYEPPPASPAAAHWASPLIWQNYETYMAQSDGIIVTGPGLAELFSKAGSKEIFVLENHYPERLKPFEELWPKGARTVNIGWGGSLGHISDLLSSLPVLRQLVSSLPGVALHVMGNVAIEDLLRLPKDRVRFTPWGSVQSYYEFWEPVHIGIAPMLDTAYNRCRSDIKAVEMAARGVLPVLPDALPYRKFCRETGTSPYSSAAELAEKLRRYILDREAAREDARRCYEYVRLNRIGPERRERLELYQRMMPGTPSDYAGNIPPGSHELMGTPQTEPDYAKVLTAARNSLKVKRAAEALALLTKAVKESPLNNELLYSYARLLAAARAPELKTVIQSTIAVFPRDLRFLLLGMEVFREADFGDRLIQELETLPPLSREVFHPETVRVISGLLAAQAISVETAQRFSELYPSSAPLHFEAGQAFEKAGRYEEARGHFSWLVEQEQVFALSKDFFGSVQRSYLHSWHEFLKNV